MLIAPNRQSWKGSVRIRPGLGIFQGYAGDNAEHRHWAHQLSIGQGSDLMVVSGGVRYQAAAVFIRADTPHQLIPGPVLSIYFDPTSAIAKGLCLRFSANSPLVTFSNSEIQWLAPDQDRPASIDDVDGKLNRLAITDEVLPDDSKLKAVITALEQSIRHHEEIGRHELASLATLSESRFSHWFREQTGMPLRSYRKWLRLIFGMESALRGHNLTEAAHEARFADQAHFSRTFSLAFGVSPSEALAHMKMPSEHDS